MRRIRRRESSTRPSQQAGPPANAWGFTTELLRIAASLLTKPPSAPPPSPAAKASSEVFYEAMVKRIEWQLKASEAYDTKTASWFALTTLVVSISATAIAAEHALLYWLPITLAAIGSLFWLGALVASYLVWQIGQVSLGPTGTDFNDLATNTAYTGTEMQLLIAEFIAHASIPNNERLLKRKASLLSWAVRFSLAEFVFYAAAVFVTLTR